MGTFSKNERARFDAELNIIRPQLLRAGWREEQILHRRKFIPGQKAPSFTLEHWPHFPLAFIRFVEDDESLITALDHATAWTDTGNGGFDIDLVYSTNGVRFEEFDKTTGQRRFLELGEFPSPRRLWNLFQNNRGLRTPKGNHLNASWGPCLHNHPKHFEATALRRIVEAIVKGQHRMSIVLGTPGSNHFLTAYLIRQLWSERLANRFLYLKNWQSMVLYGIDLHLEAMPYPIDDLVERPPKTEFRPEVIIPANRKVESRLQGFPRDYFDIVLIDEFCRRTPMENFRWQTLLDHFQPAIHVGLTAITNPDHMNRFENIIYRYTMDYALRDGFWPEEGTMWEGFREPSMPYKPLMHRPGFVKSQGTFPQVLPGPIPPVGGGTYPLPPRNGA